MPMRHVSFSAFCVLIFLHVSLSQIPLYDILLKGGRVIDPKNGIDASLDIGIIDDRIAAIQPDIPRLSGIVILDINGMIVTPGLVDIHCHFFYGHELNLPEEGQSYNNAPASLQPDAHTLKSGVTTAVDLGTSGWKNFRYFKENVIDRAETRILAFLNIVGTGMKGRNIIEQNLEDMDATMAGITALQYEEIVGIKIAHYDSPDFFPVLTGIEAASSAGLPIAVDFGFNPLPIGELLLNIMREGDILTHTYALSPPRESLVNPDTFIVRPFVAQALGRGRLFDVGHGGGGFHLRQAIPAIQQRFLPTSISTDLHRGSVLGGMKDLSNVMSKFMAMGN